MWWLFRGLRRGVVTTRYPKEVDEWARALPTPPQFDAERLTHRMADKLSTSCPSGALQRDQSDLVLDVAKCSACARCIDLSAGIARPSGLWELAALRREDLIKRIPIGGDKV
jgi:ferredoxin